MVVFGSVPFSWILPARWTSCSRSGRIGLTPRDGDTVRGGDPMLDDASEIDESFAYWDERVDAV